MDDLIFYIVVIEWASSYIVYYFSLLMLDTPLAVTKFGTRYSAK